MSQLALFGHAIDPEWKDSLKLFARHLLEHGSITENEWRDGYGKERAAARAYELRREGWKVETTYETHAGSRYARYVLR